MFATTSVCINIKAYSACAILFTNLTNSNGTFYVRFTPDRFKSVVIDKFVLNDINDSVVIAILTIFSSIAMHGVVLVGN